MSKKQRKMLGAAALLMGIVALCLLAAAGLEPAVQKREAAALAAALQRVLPAPEGFVRAEPRPDADEAILAVYEGGGGTVVAVEVYGYVGRMVVLVGVDGTGAVSGVCVARQGETRGIGERAARDPAFLAQFAGKRGELALGQQLDAYSGATVTSKAVTRAVNLALGYLNGTDAGSGATEWGD